MTLVMVGCLPFLAVIGALLAKFTTMMDKESNAAYVEVWTGCGQGVEE
jgi:hypothetical protein